MNETMNTNECSETNSRLATEVARVLGVEPSLLLEPLFARMERTAFIAALRQPIHEHVRFELRPQVAYPASLVQAGALIASLDAEIRSAKNLSMITAEGGTPGSRLYFTFMGGRGRFHGNGRATPHPLQPIEAESIFIDTVLDELWASVESNWLRAEELQAGAALSRYVGKTVRLKPHPRCNPAGYTSMNVQRIEGTQVFGEAIRRGSRNHQRLAISPTRLMAIIA